MACDWPVERVECEGCEGCESVRVCSHGRCVSRVNIAHLAQHNDSTIVNE